MFTGRGRQLTVFVSESDHYQHQSLYMAIIEMLRREGCSGATATRGIAGFGASSLIRTSAILRLSLDQAVVITVVDRPQRMERLLAPLRTMAPNALITVQDLEVIQSGAPSREGLPDVKVSDMRREVASVHPESPLTSVIELLLDKNYTAVPVLEHDRKVVGVISENDLLTRGGMKATLSLQQAVDPEYVRELQQSLGNPDRTASEVMTKPATTVSPETPLGEAARLMVDKHLKRLPVVDREGKLVGILGRLDILKLVAAVQLPEWHPEAHPIGEQALVEDVMTQEVPVVGETAKVEEIFDLLVASSHKRVVVINDRRHVVGIVADSDLISRVSRESRPGIMEVLISKVPIARIGGEARKHIQKLRARSANEFMTRDVITVRDKMPVASALALSAEKRVKRLPVVDAQDELVGIVGRTEMMRALLGRREGERGV